MIKISHETPIALLKDSLIFNDYQYALVHLFEEQEKYLEHFETCRDTNVPVLLDNSIFELGEAFDADKFAYWVDRTRPDEYIIPDVLENAIGTVSNAQSWMIHKTGLPGKKIGVVQGDSYEDLVWCYKEILATGVDKIAISFNYAWFEREFPHPNKLVSWMMGRIMLLGKMLEDGVIDTRIPHHLLGCSLPQEFKYYRDYKWIESLDTSNPVVAGIGGVKYGEEGLMAKSPVKLFEIIDQDVSAAQKQSVFENARAFRKIVNG